MHNFTKEDFEGNGIQFSIGDINLKVRLLSNGKYYCNTSFTQGSETVTCGSECKHFKNAIKSAMGKLAWCLIELGDIAKLSDKDGGEWFCKAFVGDHIS